MANQLTTLHASVKTTVPSGGEFLISVPGSGGRAFDVFSGYLAGTGITLTGATFSLGTVPLASIAQGGATSGQALAWNGTAWAPTTVSSGGSATSLGTAAPLANGTAAAGTAVAASHEDHVHPTDVTRAPLASPTFTGIPAAPTATSGTNTTQLASTAFVQTALAGISGGGTPSATVPLMDGTAAVGTSTNYARSDHVHPSDTTRLPISGGTLTGPVLAAADPASALGLATKQYVDAVKPLTVVTIDGSTIPATSGTPYQMLTSDRNIYVNKTTGAATFITLPTSPTIGVTYDIKDGKGDAQTNNVTVAAPSGSTIDGASTIVLTANRQARSLKAMTSTVWGIF